MSPELFDHFWSLIVRGDAVYAVEVKTNEAGVIELVKSGRRPRVERVLPYTPKVRRAVRLELAARGLRAVPTGTARSRGP